MGDRRVLAGVVFGGLMWACGAQPVAPASDAGGAEGSVVDPGFDAAALPKLPMTTGAGRFALPGRMEDAIEVVVPAKLPAKPPLLLVFHGTGGEPAGVVADFDLAAKAESLGFVAIAPRAGYRNGVHPGDVCNAENWGDSSWNMWTASPEQNEDLVYVRALIEAARVSWGADTTRVYALGFSNGGYFSYFAAASMPDRIAGFAENGGGWASDACPSRIDSDGASLYPLSTPAPAGQDVTCATVFADAAFPQQCRVTMTNRLRPPKNARVPFGYIGHYTNDADVSVVWSCVLGEALGGRAQTRIRASDLDGTTGHNVMPGFIDGAWAFFGGRTVAE